jgi:outer membrane protein OmpA-like peptidoglycan-associated protein
MRTLAKASFAHGIRLAALSALPVLGVFALAGTAAAQAPSPFGPPAPLPPGAAPPGAQPFQPGAGPQPFQPGPGAPGVAPFGPPPGQFGPAPGQPGQPGGPAPMGPGGDLNPQPPPTGDQPAPAPDAEQTPEEEQQERWLGLMEQTNLYGSTGWLHSAYAGSGPAGTFRVSFLSNWFTAGSFLCRPGDIAYGNVDKACTKGSTQSDTTSRVGGTFVINATPLPFLEAYALLNTYATSNDQGNPQLLQVLGDTTLAVKGFLPPKLGRIFTFGGEAQLLLLNGTGGVGVSGAGTSGIIRAMGSIDTRQRNDGGFPFRANVNIGYHIDNSGQLVLAVEQARAKAAGITNPTTGPNGGPPPDPTQARLPITRIERFGLGINKVDSLPIVLAAGLPFSRVQPYLEWSVDVPVNRQQYYCHTGRLSNGDVCLGLGNPSAANPGSAGGPGFAAIPSRFTLGVKTNPLPMRTWHGLSAHAAVDIGTSGVHTFIEEMAPQAPWTLYIGVGFVYDTREPPAPAAPVAAPVKEMVPAPQTFVRGLVHEAGRNDVLVADAIVSFEGGVQAPVATGPDGRFVTRHLEPGTYKFDIKAHHFKPGSCVAVVSSGAPAAPPPPMGAPPGAPGNPDAPLAPFGAAPSPFGAPPGAPGAPGMPGAPLGAAPPPVAPAVPAGPTYVDIDCPLEGLPRMGNVFGMVRDTETGAPVSGAIVKLTEASGKEVTATADGGGNFVFKDLPPGAVMIRAEASGYMPHVNPPLDVRASEDARPTLQLAKRPKVASVKIEGKEIKISKQIHFETDSSKIMGDSNALMEEIVDVMQRNTGIRKVEIQGHTDNTGTADHNLQLSDARAASVKAWMVGAGVDPARLVPKGYGQTRPLAPNVTAGNRARNRRVQFIILEGK